MAYWNFTHASSKSLCLKRIQNITQRILQNDEPTSLFPFISRNAGILVAIYTLHFIVSFSYFFELNELAVLFHRLFSFL